MARKYYKIIMNVVREPTAGIQCPLCFKYVSDLKSGCHVIPRWLSVLTKDEKGRYFEISFYKRGPNQSDIKTKSWCESCEKEFAILDGVGARFFRDNVVFSEENTERVNKYVFRNLDTYYAVRKFVSSIIVRHYLYAVSNRQPIRQSEFFLNEFYKEYLKDSDVCIVLHDMRKFLLSTSSTPIFSQESIQIVINGFLVVVTMDRKPLGSAPIENGEVLFYNVTDPETPYIKKFLNIIRAT